jgi:hypothetical protein
MCCELLNRLFEVELKLVDDILRASTEAHEFDYLVLQQVDETDDVVVVTLFLLASREAGEYAHILTYVIY